MSKKKRGPDRRRTRVDTSLPITLKSGDIILSDRRKKSYRRNTDYISHQIICAGIPYSELEPVFSECTIEELKKDEILLNMGQQNDCLYMLITGLLEVRLDSPESTSGFPILVGECVGEMSIIDYQPVSAYVVAKENSRVLAIPGELFWSRLAHIPGLVRNMMRILNERMRKNNEVVLRAMEHKLRMETIERDLQMAREVQESMLPRYHPLFPDHPQISVAAYMEAAREVGGDMYDAFPLDKEHICISVGDVSGKGMPAALFMVKSLTLLRTEISKGDCLSNVIQRVNKEN